MSRLTLGDRLVSGAFAAVFGAIIGAAAAWLFGVYSNTLGASTATVDIKRWVLNSSLGFGLVGLVIGPHAGTLVGTILNAMFEFENSGNQLPGWIIVALVIAAGFVVWWYFVR